MCADSCGLQYTSLLFSSRQTMPNHNSPADYMYFTCRATSSKLRGIQFCGRPPVKYSVLHNGTCSVLHIRTASVVPETAGWCHLFYSRGTPSLADKSCSVAFAVVWSGGSCKTASNCGSRHSSCEYMFDVAVRA